MTQLSLEDSRAFSKSTCEIVSTSQVWNGCSAYRVNKRLDHITIAENFPGIVFEVVKKAEQENFIPELLKAVIGERETLRRDLQGILDRCQIDSCFQPQMDSLRKILLERQQPDPLAKQCFQESRPPYSNEWQPKGEVSASNYADHLAIFSANDKSCYPILRYVYLLSQHNQQDRLQNWLQEAALCLAKNNQSLAQRLLAAAHEPQQPPAAIGEDRPPTLFVQIEPNGDNKALLKVSMWFIAPKPSAMDLPRAELMTLRNLKSKLQDRLGKIAEEFNLADLEVHFILPGKLLVDWDADQWPLPVGGLPLRPELGYFCRVLIRPLERARNRIMLNSLKRRWKELREHFRTPCEWLNCFDLSHCQSHVVICMPPHCQNDLYRWLRQAELVMGAALYPAPGRLKTNDATATLYHLFLEGVPAIFWLRSTATASDADTEITTLKALVAGRCLRDLPHTIWELRCRRGSQNPITLIWDDPDWLPEVIERQAALKS